METRAAGSNGDRLGLVLVVASVAVVLTAGYSVAGEAAGKRVVEASIDSDQVMVFHGIPEMHGWGEPVIFQATDATEGTRQMGVPWLGGIPLVDIWSETGGVAIFNLASAHEPFAVVLTVEPGTVTISAQGGSNMVVFPHQGDCYDALREFATRMRAQHGVAVRTAPGWAFDSIWETYGFEESWSAAHINTLLPLIHELGIKTVTLDSGWYGTGTTDWSAYTGDFPINADVIGTEQDLLDLIGNLHNHGLRVRLWWVAGVAEDISDLYTDHPEWVLTKVTPSWGDPDHTGDWYLDPSLPAVRAWNIDLVERLVGYGVDGFKIDDVYEIDSASSTIHQDYSALFEEIFDTAFAIDPAFSINVCNCGIAQNFFHFGGENQLITSDPVGAIQFRRRAKYLHALNIAGGAILGDHIELTQGDVGAGDMADPTFYANVSDSDFASSVALGMVLQTKFALDPGDTYRRWFSLYDEHRFFAKQWVNIPYFAWSEVETCLMRDGGDLYFSFFHPSGGDFTGNVVLSHLEVGESYQVWDLVAETLLTSFQAASSEHSLAVSFSGSLVLEVLCGGCIFFDGFEVGDLSKWTGAVGAAKGTAVGG